MSFLELSLRLQVHKPPLIVQQYLIRRRKILFLTQLLLVFPHPHTSCVRDDLCSPSFHSFSPSITYKLKIHHSIKRKRKNEGFLLDWTVKRDANRRTEDNLIPVTHAIYSFYSNGMFHICKNIFLDVFHFLQSLKRFHVNILKAILSQSEDI